MKVCQELVFAQEPVLMCLGSTLCILYLLPAVLLAQNVFFALGALCVAFVKTEKLAKHPTKFGV